MYLLTFLLDCIRGKYREPIEKIRDEPDKNKRDELKKLLPAVTIQSEPCTKRGKTYCKNNGILCLDIDGVDDPEEAKRKLISLPYVLAVFISASGKGVFVICVLAEPADDLKPIMEAMQRDIAYPIDEKCSDTSRLRFATDDPKPAVNYSPTPFVLPVKTDNASHRAEIVRDAKNGIERARAYIEKMPPAISGHGGHDDALKVANILYEFGLNEDEAFRGFKDDYNPRCQPEWSDEEIRHKISEAFNKPLNEHGSKLRERKNGSLNSDSEQRQSKKVETRLKLILSSEVEEKEITWLWRNKIPCGMLSLVAGLAGVGKSFWTVYMTAVITNGWNWADGNPCKQGSVLFFYGEEGIADAYKKRFRANGADQSKIVFLSGIESIDRNDEHSEIDMTLNMVAEIEQAIRETAEITGLPVRMIVIDPISNYWGKTKEDSNVSVRSVLKPLQLLAERTGVAFVLIQHVGKGEKAYAQQNVLGSTGIVAICRSVWGIYVDPNDKDKRIFAKLKVNCGFNHTAVSYKIIPPDGKVEIIEASISVSNPPVKRGVA